MKVGSSPPLFHTEPRKEVPAKKSFKEIQKRKPEKKQEEPLFNLYLPQPKLEIPPEEYLLELTETITHAIENHTVFTELNVHGTTIMIEQSEARPGQLHIQITTQNEQFHLLNSHLGQLDLALKAALPHISCHLAPLKVHKSSSRIKYGQKPLKNGRI